VIWLVLSHQPTSVQDVIQRLISNRERDYFNCIAITGQVRRGKSRLAFILSRGVYPEFSFENNYIGNPQHNQTFKNLFDAPAKSAAWLDEAAKVLSTDYRFTKEQIWLARLFEQFASHNKSIFLCTPSFILIDPKWRRTHITVWIHVFARGKAILLIKRDVQSSLDVWGLKAMEEKELSARTDELTDDRILQNFDENPCAVAYFTFPDWETKEQKDEYISWKTKSQQDLRKEFDVWEKQSAEKKVLVRKEIALARMALVCSSRGIFSVDEVARIAGYKPNWIYTIMKNLNWLIATSEDFSNALPKQYFDEELIEFCKVKASEEKSHPEQTPEQ